MRRFIVVVEPSPFRREETYIKGPFGRFRAWVEAHLEVWFHPFALVRVVQEECVVDMGGRILWDGRKTKPEFSFGPYR